VRGEPEAARRLDILIEKAKEAGGLADPLARGRLASLLDYRGKHKEALGVLGDTSVTAKGETPSGARAALGLLEGIVTRHVALEEERNRRLMEGGAGQHGLPMEAVDASISAEEFRERFILPGTPCIVKNSGVPPSWTPETLVERLGSRRVPLRGQGDPTSTEWAQLEFRGTAPFDSFVQEHILGQASSSSSSSSPPVSPDGKAPPQLFDFSIWQSCSDVLADEVVMPKWFGVDLYTHATCRVNPVTGSASPTVFLASKGTQSGLHVDFLHTHFWMAMCYGRKRWRVVHRDDLSLFYPRYLGDFNPTFPAGLDDMVDEESRPAARLANVYEVILEPGDLIYVPAGSPHKVENLDTTVAVSANFVDRSNVKQAHAEASLLGLVSEDPGLVASSFEESQRLGGALEELEGTMPSETHEPLRLFKARHGELRSPQETQQRLLTGFKVTVGVIALSVGAWFYHRSTR